MKQQERVRDHATALPLARWLWLGFLLIAGFVAVNQAEARAIRFDSGDEWSDPSSDPTGQLGFNFDFFGVQTTTVEISDGGSVSFGGATISPFVEGQDTSFTWQNTTETPLPGTDDGILNGFRVCWNCESNSADELSFQLAIFDLGSGNYAMEFNYGALPFGGGAQPFVNVPFIGYDNGQGETFDLFAALGLDPENPTEWAGNCENGPPGPDLACNNYDFTNDTPMLPGGFNDYFRLNPSFGEPAFGRYMVFIPQGVAAPVPGPATAGLLVAGLLGLGIARRRRSGD